MEKKYNLRSPAVKRLMREAKELCEPTEQYYAQPLEDNLFEWHFTVQGPADSDFENGRYHGRITLPPEYPMKPPSIMLLTPNGRFEIGRKICLSMSAHHPETWQPSWSIRTVLLAIIGFMPTKGGGAIASLDYTPEERKVLAKKSMQWKCNVCDSCNASALKEAVPGSERKANKEIEELAGQITFKGENETKTDAASTPQSSAVTSIGSYTDEPPPVASNQALEEIRTAEEAAEGLAETPPPGTEQDKSTSNVRKRASKRSSSRRTHGQNTGALPPTTTGDSSYITTFLIILIVTCLVVLLIRRISMNYFYTEST